MRNYLILLFLFSYTFSFAQTEEHLIYLKDGSMYKGVVKAYNFATETYEIEIEGAIISLVEKKEIKRITSLRPNDFFLKNGRSLRTKGYTLGLDYGAGFGKFNSYSNNLNIQIGRYIKPRILLGIGVGFENYIDNRNFFSFNFIPVYTHFRHFPIQKTISPYYALDLGWGFNSSGSINYLNGFFRGNLLLKPALGLRIASRKSSTFLVEAGYSFQRVYLEYGGFDRVQNTYVDAKGFIILSRFTLNIGWLF